MFQVSADFSSTVAARGLYAIFGIWLLVTVFAFVPFFVYGIFVRMARGKWNKMVSYIQDYLYFITALFVFAIHYFGTFIFSKGYLAFFLSFSFIALSLPIKSFLIRKVSLREKVIDCLSYHGAIVAFCILLFANYDFYSWLVLDVIQTLLYLLFFFRKIILDKIRQMSAKK